MADIFDYVIVGGGTAGCVLASRLKTRDPSLQIAIIEAGPDVSKHPVVLDGGKYALLLESEIDWNYRTVPQRHLGGRVISHHAGKSLGGSSSMNGGGWLRGDREDYDYWGKLVGDPRWSYEGFLPHFRNLEHHYDHETDPEVHGHHGPMIIESASSMGRQYPLREPIKEAWHTVGLRFNPDLNSGNPLGLAEVVENRSNGLRQMSSSVYTLDVHILTETFVKRVVVEERDGKKVATAVEIVGDDNKTIRARREIIFAAGAYRTPQLLMLSGIGPAEELKRHGINVLLDLPDVGRNLHDHPAITQWWKLKNPEKGLSVGSSTFNDPVLFKGLPVDFVAIQSASPDGLREALAKDQTGQNPDKHPLISVRRAHIETVIFYVACNSENPTIETDGTHITTAVVCLTPTSRGSITLANNDPRSSPLIDPNYCATETDRFILREGVRKLRQVLRNTPAGQSIVEEETTEDDARPLSANSTDEEVDELIRRRLGTIFHAAGTASMGKVVDNELRVKGIEGLRVVDASVIPFALATHIQMCVYAIGEQAADILQGRRA